MSKESRDTKSPHKAPEELHVNFDHEDKKSTADFKGKIAPVGYMNFCDEESQPVNVAITENYNRNSLRPLNSLDFSFKCKHLISDEEAYEGSINIKRKADKNQRCGRKDERRSAFYKPVHNQLGIVQVDPEDLCKFAAKNNKNLKVNKSSDQLIIKQQKLAVVQFVSIKKRTRPLPPKLGQIYRGEVSQENDTNAQNISKDHCLIYKSRKSQRCIIPHISHMSEKEILQAPPCAQRSFLSFPRVRIRIRGSRSAEPKD